MEQIFMLEVFVEKIVLKVEPPEKGEATLKWEAEEKARLEGLEAAAANKKGKKGKAGGKGKKGKKGKEPPEPSVEELKYAQLCSVTMECLPLFSFYLTHDRFVEPPVEVVPAKGKKGKGGKGKGKGKKGKAPVVKIQLPKESLPEPPYFNVGQSVIFTSRPQRLKEIMKMTPIKVSVWNKDSDLNCVGFVIVNWDEAFYRTLDRANALYPLRLDQEFHDTSDPGVVSTTLEITRPLQCEEDLRSSGEMKFFVRLTCLGNKVISKFITLPESTAIPGRSFCKDNEDSRHLEAIRNWQVGDIDQFLPVTFIYTAPNITEEPILPPGPPPVFDEYVAPYTTSELAILAMGFPKGPCGGTNCPKRMDARGDEYQFIPGNGPKEMGRFVNAHDVHGPCGRLDCPLAAKVREYLKGEGAYQPCKKPCGLNEDK